MENKPKVGEIWETVEGFLLYVEGIESPTHRTVVVLDDAGRELIGAGGSTANTQFIRRIEEAEHGK